MSSSASSGSGLSASSSSPAAVSRKCSLSWSLPWNRCSRSPAWRPQTSSTSSRTVAPRPSRRAAGSRATRASTSGKITTLIAKLLLSQASGGAGELPAADESLSAPLEQLGAAGLAGAHVHHQIGHRVDRHAHEQRLVLVLAAEVGAD